ncbi:MAG TPA: hypothetical protein VNL17_13245 [Verrucomicrobiae bacterium]|nr:hypothetical protein [Verrucomicrobiae bacterium]
MSTIIRWDQARWDITYSFDALSSFLDTMEAQLEEVRRLEGARLQAEYDSFKSKDQKDYAFFMADYEDEVQAQKHRLDVMFPRILRYSLATQLFMLIETNFDAVCDEIAKRRKLRLRSRDFRGALFDRVKLFMNAAASLPLVYDKSWQDLTKLQKVRDCIAHVGGKIEESRDHEYLRKLIVEHQDVAGPDEDGRLELERTFCIKMIAASKSAFNQIFETAGFGPAQPTFETKTTS